MVDQDFQKQLDETGHQLLTQLRKNARLTYKELGERVNLSAPAVAERIQKMEDAGIIRGYHTDVNLDKLGLSTQAMVHLRGLGGKSCDWVADRLEKIPEVDEIFRITGDDSMMIKLAARSADQLAVVLDELSKYGIPETSILRLID